jgi:hypothetical protein
VVTGLSWVIQAGPARWQRQAAAGPAALLDAHPGLAAIAWTAGPGGHVRDVSGAWRTAAAEYREHQPGGSAAWLPAAARRDLVRVRLTATVPAGVQEDR